jgi:hypothetical protein
MPWGFAAAGVASAVVGSVLAPEAPDNSDAINKQTEATERVGMRQLDLAEKQYADQQELVKKYSPMFDEQMQLSLDSQKKQNQQSDDQWASYKNYFMPTEQALATKSLNYDTPERREKAAGDAMATTRSSFDQQQQALDAGLSSASVDPSSGAAIAARRQMAGAGAAATAAAGNTARTAVEDKGMAYLDNAARFGRNMTSTGLQAASQATATGNNATGQAAGLQSFTAAPANSSAALFSSAGNSFAQAGNMQLGLQNSQNAVWAKQAQLTQDQVNSASKTGLGLYDIYTQK